MIETRLKCVSTTTSATNEASELAREYEEQGFPRGLWWDSATYELPGKLTSTNTGKSVVVD